MQCLTAREYGIASTKHTVYITEYGSFHISARGFDCTQTYADTK